MILTAALATCKLIQQLLTLLRQQCCVLLRPYCSGVQTVQQLPTSDTTCNIQQCCVLLRPYCSGVQTVQQLPTSDATCNIQQRCVRLHEALLTIERQWLRERQKKQ